MSLCYRITALMAAFLLAACGADETAAPTPANEPVAASVAVADTAPAASAAEAATAASDEGPIQAFTAFGGQDTSWRAVVDGENLMLEGEDVGGEQTLVVDRLAFSKGVDFNARDPKHNITLTINSNACTLDGQSYTFTARLQMDGKTFKGCAEAGALLHAPT